MTGKNNPDLNPVMPLDAHAARIARDGGLASSLRESPEAGTPHGYHAAGTEPDGLDSIVPQAAGSRTDFSRSVPRPSVQAASDLNSNPT